MPTFETPAPVTLNVEIGVGDIRIDASDRTDTAVEVRPSDARKKGDVAAAAATVVEYADGVLVVRAPRGWKQWLPWGGGESVDVRIALPAGSHVEADASVGSLHATGRIGDCRYRTSLGAVGVDTAASVHLKTGGGDITVREAAGDATLATGTGAVRVGSVGGETSVKNSNGNTWIGHATDDLHVSAANGTIAVDRARAAVTAKTANGDVRLGDVARGTVLAQTAYGKVDVGVRDGVAAWLDLDTGYGSVRNDLDDAPGPQPGDDVVEVRAHTACGDVTIRRAHADARP